MSKYCPAGKINCENLARGSKRGNMFCGDDPFELTACEYEQCPWPSRQRPVVKAGDDALSFEDKIVKQMAEACSKAREEGIKISINEGVERCGRAIRESVFYEHDCPQHYMLTLWDALTAIAACKVKP
jgi:hypothetical protein